MKKALLLSLLVMMPFVAIAQKPQSFIENSKYGLRDCSQKVILEPVYDYICTKIKYSGGNMLVRVADSCFLVNPTTNQTSLLSDLPRMSKQTLYPAIIADGDKYGYIDTKGRVIVEGQWDHASDFRNGLARVVVGEGDLLDAISYPNPGRTGYIDTLGRYVIPLDYSFIDYFAPNAHVTRFTNGKYVCSDPMGCENPYKGSKWGLIDTSGKIIVADTKYDFIDRPVVDQKSGKIVFGVVSGDRMGLIDGQGAEIFPLAQFSSLGQMWDAYLK